MDSLNKKGKIIITEGSSTKYFNIILHSTKDRLLLIEVTCQFGLQQTQSTKLDYKRHMPANLDHKRHIPANLDYKRHMPANLDYKRHMPAYLDYKRLMSVNLDYKGHS